MQLDAIREVQIESAEGWRKLWGQAVQERDPNRLMKLLAQTNDLLDQEIAPSQTRHPPIQSKLNENLRPTDESRP